ncbi:hypothetical protein LF95_04120 [Thalassospira sp. TSL5-1]|nr:hypothetical protein LF95_04120 [Thalassospira sp. TSL5-1]
MFGKIDRMPVDRSMIMQACVAVQATIFVIAFGTTLNGSNSSGIVGAYLCSGAIFYSAITFYVLAYGIAIAHKKQLYFTKWRSLVIMGLTLMLVINAEIAGDFNARASLQSKRTDTINKCVADIITMRSPGLLTIGETFVFPGYLFLEFRNKCL